MSQLFNCWNEQKTIRPKGKDEWKDFVLHEIISFLGNRKDEIYQSYSNQREGELPLALIEKLGLMVFELAVTFLQDKQSGLGRGFLGLQFVGEQRATTRRRG